MLEVVLEGVVLVEADGDDRDVCIISGLIYREGDHLIEAGDGETPVRLVALEDDRAVLQILPTEHEVVVPYPR